MADSGPTRPARSLAGTSPRTLPPRPGVISSQSGTFTSFRIWLTGGDVLSCQLITYWQKSRRFSQNIYLRMGGGGTILVFVQEFSLKVSWNGEELRVVPLEPRDKIHKK